MKEKATAAWLEATMEAQRWCLSVTVGDGRHQRPLVLFSADRYLASCLSADNLLTFSHLSAMQLCRGHPVRWLTRLSLAVLCKRESKAAGRI